MYKKQLLRVGNSKKSKAITGLVIGLLMVGSVAGAVSAGNIGNTSYQYNSTSKGFATETRDKIDYTSAYIEHYGVNGATVQVHSGGVNFTVGGSRFAAAQSWSYLPNYVKENGFNNCYLYIKLYPEKGCYMYGAWSPDSI